MKISANYLHLAVMLFLSSCAVGPDYRAPDLELPQAYLQQLGSKAAEADLSWWNNFDDPKLSALITEAVANNHDVLIALSRVNQSRALARQAFAELLPGAQVAASYEKAKSANTRFPGRDEASQNDVDDERSNFEYEVYTTSIDALWELDIFGRLRRAVEARDADQEAAIANLDDALRLTIAEIAMTYIDLRGAQKQLEIANKNLDLQQDTLSLAEAKFRAGESSELDSLRAKADLEATRAAIFPLEVAKQVSLNRIAVLLGKNPGQISGELETLNPIPTVRSAIAVEEPNSLLRRRPDLRAAERQLAAETARIGVAIGELYPKISLQGSIGLEAPKFSQLSNSAAEIYSYGPRLTWSPFDLGSLRQAVKAQRAVSDEALLRYQQSVLLALEDAENSLSRYANERKRREKLAAAFEAAKKAYHIARDQYKEGVLDFFSVLESQRTMLENESNFVESEQNLALYTVGIYKAFGGGWENWRLEEKQNS